MVSEYKKERLLRKLLSGKPNRKKEKQLSLSEEALEKSEVFFQKHPSLPNIYHPNTESEMQKAHRTYQREKAAHRLIKKPHDEPPPQKIPKLERPRILTAEDEDED